MKKESLLYGAAGIIIGALLVGFVACYAVNYNHKDIMNILGFNSNRVMSGDIDRTFIEQMIPHHESAIAMAQLAQQKATHTEIKTLAGNVIASQSGEIKAMKQWYKNWYGKDVPIMDVDPMWSYMMSAHASIDILNNATNFDETFLNNMIAHHQMAVMMADMLGAATNRSEMKDLAHSISASQTKEINDMESWQQAWGYTTLRRDSENMPGM